MNVELFLKYSINQNKWANHKSGLSIKLGENFAKIIKAASLIRTLLTVFI